MYPVEAGLGRTAIEWRAAWRHGGLGMALLAAGVARAAHASMEPMDEPAMAAINARGALFVADKIGPSNTGTGANPTDFTYYRMGLDVELAMNLNIDRLRLGCGGSNDQLVDSGTNGATCDMSMYFLRFMGLDASGIGAGAAVTSDFVMVRPYVELAIKNDGTRNSREVVGIKIGARSAHGLLGIGRTYEDGQTNVESGAACGGGFGSPPVNRDPDCHSGVDFMSGYMRIEASGNAHIYASLGNDADACFGYTRTNTTDPCGPADALFQSLYGTRMSLALLYDIPLKLYNKNGSLLPDTGQADIQENLSFLHEIALDKTKTKDFFISFQRERVGYPIFDQATPYDTDGDAATANSRFSKTANTGWWMNVPYAAMLDVQAGNVCLGLLSSLEALATISEGVNLQNLSLGQVPVDNCYGAPVFC
ncbi:MAG: hypothetical protein ACOY4U_11935 [Pseudomonadota bacterium]